MNGRVILIGVLLSTHLLGCAEVTDHATSEVVVLSRASVPDAPDDPAWGQAPHHDAKLLLQDMVEPRLLDLSTPSVEVRAITDGSRIAFKLRWSDPTRDDLPEISRFADACAVQLPRGSAPDVPAPQMGEDGRVVEIAFWRATWQAAVDGRKDDIRSLHPNAAVDHYPFEAPSLTPGSPEQLALADQYAPAAALGHRMEGPRERPVEDLLAEGPGTLTPALTQHSTGRGARVGGSWEVVIVRPLPAGLDTTRRTQIAFAVWNGSHDEVGARKMRSAWIPLHVENGEAG